MKNFKQLLISLSLALGLVTTLGLSSAFAGYDSGGAAFYVFDCDDDLTRRACTYSGQCVVDVHSGRSSYVSSTKCVCRCGTNKFDWVIMDDISDAGKTDAELTMPR